ncbi:MAG: hypothetical protein HQ592_14425 [Planctomycetes bacterium]|nr:hypothetical protein [Planctomycetota bacterium]
MPNETPYLPEHLRTAFRELVKDAVAEGLCALGPIDSHKHYIGSYLDFPTVSESKNGLPSIQTRSMTGPTNYAGAFGDAEESKIRYDSLPAFAALLDFVSKDRQLTHLLSWVPETSEMDKPESQVMRRISIFYFLTDLIDRHVHSFRSFDLTDLSFSQIFGPIERFMFADELALQVVAPILFVKFGFDDLELAPGYRISRMGSSFNVARASLYAYGPGVHSSVLAAASHAVVLDGWTWKRVPPRPLRLAPDPFSNTGAYPVERIDDFFAAFRVVTGHATGYAQLIVKPDGWARRYTADLPPLEGTSIRAYPMWFENFYWLAESLPEVDAATGRQIGELLGKLLDVEENSVRLATRRLNLCFLRDGVEDRILDATIGLEAALSDDQPQEMTHKLAMRVAALCQVAADFGKSGLEAFRDIKQVYAYRSALVHGSTAANRKKEILQPDGRRIAAHSVAIDYLRLVLRILIENSRYRKPRNIDEDVISGKVGEAKP